MDTTIQLSYYQYLKDFVEQNLTLLRTNRVYIFGAGYRGCNLLQLLHMFQISDIVFVDNDSKKQGLKIEDCPIISFSQANQYSGKHIFLCPVENGVPILDQLKESGRTEGKDYFNLDFHATDYLQVIEELRRPVSEYSLLLGSCCLSSCILGDHFTPALGETLKKELLPLDFKACALPGFDPVMDFYIIRFLGSIQKELPRVLVIDTTLSSLSPYDVFMLDIDNYRQHILLLKQLSVLMPFDIELQEYLELLKHRMKHSMYRSNLTAAVSSDSSLKQIYKLKYTYNLRENTPSVVYTTKILEQMNRKNIPVVIIFHPIDYQRGERICGKSFPEMYASSVRRFEKFVDRYSYTIIDASFIATSEYFVPSSLTPDTNPILNINGQKLFIDKLKSQIGMK